MTEFEETFDSIENLAHAISCITGFTSEATSILIENLTENQKQTLKENLRHLELINSNKSVLAYLIRYCTDAGNFEESNFEYGAEHEIYRENAHTVSCLFFDKDKFERSSDDRKLVMRLSPHTKKRKAKEISSDQRAMALDFMLADKLTKDHAVLETLRRGEDVIPVIENRLNVLKGLESWIYTKEQFETFFELHPRFNK